MLERVSVSVGEEVKVKWREGAGGEEVEKEEQE